MLYHHGSEKYEVAASAAAKHARGVLEALIEKGKTNALGVIEKIQTEVPVDKVVKGPAMRFLGDSQGLQVQLGDERPLGLHRNALQQLAERGPVAIPQKVIADLQSQGAWGGKLIAHTLEEIYQHSNERYLTRAYAGQVRGFLSNKFRRLDSRPIIDAFAVACQKIGAIPVEGYGTDTKVAIKALLPMVFEPVPNEVMAIGVVWQNSDYGNGAHSLRAFMLRLWCTNYGITEECMREVHLGTRLGDDDVFSQRTYELDTRLSASKIKDVIEATLSPPKVHALLGAIKNANEDKIDPKNVAAFLKKRLGVGDAKEVIDAFNSPDVENLPPGNSTWRLSNAVSWIAGKTKDKEKALDLMQYAGELVHKKAA